MIDSEDDRKSLIRKLVIYAILDLLVIIMDIIFMKSYKLKTCTMDFSDLSFYIICFSTASLLFDLVSLYQIKKGYINAIIATLSLLIDIGMEVLAILSVCMLFGATTCRIEKILL